MAFFYYHRHSVYIIYNNNYCNAFFVFSMVEGVTITSSTPKKDPLCFIGYTPFLGYNSFIALSLYATSIRRRLSECSSIPVRSRPDLLRFISSHNWYYSTTIFHPLKSACFRRFLPLLCWISSDKSGLYISGFCGIAAAACRLAICSAVSWLNASEIAAACVLEYIKPSSSSLLALVI